jgi:hypothetical protein
MIFLASNVYVVYNTRQVGFWQSLTPYRLHVAKQILCGMQEMAQQSHEMAGSIFRCRWSITKSPALAPAVNNMHEPNFLVIVVKEYPVRAKYKSCK